MFICKIMLLLLATVSVVTQAYCQEKSNIHEISIIGGKVINVDSVGNIITIQTDDQQQMAFSVPDKVSITQETHDIGLMEIRATDPVTVQYYASSPGKYVVFSIVDNKPIAS